VVRFTPRPLYPWGNRSRYPLDRRLVVPQSQSGRYGDLASAGNRTLTVQPRLPIATHYTYGTPDSADPFPLIFPLVTMLTTLHLSYITSIFRIAFVFVVVDVYTVTCSLQIYVYRRCKVNVLMVSSSVSFVKTIQPQGQYVSDPNHWTLAKKVKLTRPYSDTFPHLVLSLLLTLAIHRRSHLSRVCKWS
jgi:hypothetical protein